MPRLEKEFFSFSSAILQSWRATSVFCTVRKMRDTVSWKLSCLSMLEAIFWSNVLTGCPGPSWLQTMRYCDMIFYIKYLSYLIELESDSMMDAGELNNSGMSARSNPYPLRIILPEKAKWPLVTDTHDAGKWQSLFLSSFISV